MILGLIPGEAHILHPNIISTFMSTFKSWEFINGYGNRPAL
jgi:hypothetical protein